MHEIEFLPEWYPRIRRRKRVVVLQTWMTFVVALGLGAWIVMAQRNIRHAQAAMNSLDSQMAQTQTEQRQLEEQLAIKKELLLKEQIVAQLGFPVEMSRLLRSLDTIMPPEMSLVDASFETSEQLVAGSTAAALRATADKEQSIDRRLKVKLAGVAPSDVDLANFLAGLTSYSFFQKVSLVKASDKTDSGHLMREFEVTFEMDLNQPLPK